MKTVTPIDDFDIYITMNDLYVAKHKTLPIGIARKGDLKKFVQNLFLLVEHGILSEAEFDGKIHNKFIWKDDKWQREKIEPTKDFTFNSKIML